MLRPLLIVLASFAVQANSELLDEVSLLQVSSPRTAKTRVHSVQASWDNHFMAFGTQDLAMIMKDYTSKSVINVYDQTTGKKTIYSGLQGVEECFTGLFQSLPDLSDLAAPVIEVKEASAGEPGSVFLIWSCPASGYHEATDTFIFDDDSKILYQNVALVYRDPNGAPAVEVGDQEAPTGSGPVHDGWANHFAAFGGQNVPMILEDYLEESEITVYNHADGSQTDYHGLDDIADLFSGLFEGLYDTSDLAAPIQHVVESDSPGAPGQVFLIWSAAASGYARATDTFIFNSAGKITRQNVVVNYLEPPLCSTSQYRRCQRGQGNGPCPCKKVRCTDKRVQRCNNGVDADYCAVCR